LQKETSDRIEALGDSLNHEVVGQELLKAGVLHDLIGFRLDPIRRNPERRDYLTRASYRVRSGDRTVCHLTVGAKLEDLWKRSRDFAVACPEIAARPLFLHRAGGTDFLGVEYIDGTDFQTLALQGRMPASTARAYIEKLVSGLEGTFQESTVSAADGELDAFLASVCGPPMFDGLDQRFLQELVFPLIRQGARAPPARTRWTNGDFIPCNVRIDLQGRPHLVDYEFACRTHFHGEDALRWSFFSKELPKEIRGIVPFGATSHAGSDWMEAYFLLRQMRLSAETIENRAAVGGTAAYVRDRLLQLVSAYHNGFRSSLFYKPLFARPSEGTGGSPAGLAQLYWSTDGTFGEEKSCRLQLPYEERTLLRFKLPPLSGPLHLRFDPIDATGLVHISALRVHVPSTDKTLLAISGETGWQGLNPCPGLHRLPDTRECNLMSWGTSASLLLPALDLGPTALEITVDVGIRFSAELEGLSSLLVPQAPAEAAKTREEQGSPEGDKAGPLTESEVPHTDLVTAAIRAAKLRQSLAQLEEGGRNLAALEAAVAELAASNRAHVESLLSQNDEIRRLEAVNRVAGEALIELREQLTASQRWLGELRNRTLVRLSLAIHREKWPL